MENKRYRTRNRKKAWKLSLLRNFDRLTHRQIREIAEDYRNYLTHYLRLHLSKEDFDMLVSTPYTVWESVPFTPPVKKNGYYYHEVLEEVRNAAKYLSPYYRTLFFLGDRLEYMNKKDKDTLKAAYNIYSFDEGFGMEVLRNYFYDYADSCFDIINCYEYEADNCSTAEDEEDPDEETVRYGDPVERAWEDTRFEEYLDTYARENSDRLKKNPWDYSELEYHYWPWREKLSWYRQKCKSAVIRVCERPLTDRERELYRIAIWDQNVPAFVDSEKILFTKDLDDFQERWFRLGVYEGVEKAFLSAKEGNGDMLCKGVAHIYDDKTFIVEEAWFTAIDWFGQHRKFHVNHWEINVQWISFHPFGSKEAEYFRIISHQAQGVCRIEIFPRMMKAVVECEGNSLLECHAPFSPIYSMKIPKNRWQRPSFEDFSDNYVRSFCYVADGIFDSEESLQMDIKDFSITTEVMRELFEEV